MKFFLFLFIWGATGFFASANEPLPYKKISILESNNSFDSLVVPIEVAPRLDLPRLKKVRSYLEKKGFHPHLTGSETDFVKQALDWVTVQWKHDGMNPAPASFGGLEILKSVHEKKARYRCVEYGLVLEEVLRAYGFVARTVRLRTADSAYGGFGQGHVAMEVWLNDLNKWIFLDPQFGALILKKDSTVPLHFQELFQEFRKGQWGDLQVEFTPKANLSAFHVEERSEGPRDMTMAAVEYKKFLSHYFGFIGVAVTKPESRVALKLDSKDEPLAFQGVQASSYLFTDRFELFYPSMNRVALVFNYRDAQPDLAQFVGREKISSSEELVRLRGPIAARPRFRVKILSSSQAQVQRYEMRFQEADKWLNLKGNEFDWDALQKLNRIEVRAVNILDRPGPSTWVVLKYD